MFFLSPGKLLVVLVVTMIVVGPDRLPSVARQIGAALQTLRQFHAKVETDLRDSIPNLPSTRDIAQFTRSPGALLHKLMELPEDGAEDPHDAGASSGFDGVPAEGDVLIDTGPALEIPATVAVGAPLVGSPSDVAVTADGVPLGDPNMN